MDPEAFKQFLAQALLQRRRSWHAESGLPTPTGQYQERQVPVTRESAQEAVARYMTEKFRMRDPQKAHDAADRILRGKWEDEDERRRIYKLALEQYHPQREYVYAGDPTEPQEFNGYRPTTGFSLSMSGSRSAPQPLDHELPYRK